MNTATQILFQLGGNKFIAMTGATCFHSGDTLIVKFKGSKIANLMNVSLNTNDTYTVEISKFRGLDKKVVKLLSNVYADMLKSVFEETTGLRTSL